jgi:molybdopterin converting factor small subunit
MTVEVHLPTALRPYADAQEVVKLQGENVGEIIQSLTSRYSKLKQHLLDDDNKPRHFINLYLNERSIDKLGGMAAPVTEGDTLLIIPAIAGG